MEETDFVGTAAPGCPGEQSSPAHSASDASEAGDQLSPAVLGTDGRGRLFPRNQFHPTAHEAQHGEALRTCARYLVGPDADFVPTFSPPHDKSLITVASSWAGESDQSLVLTLTVLRAS